MNEGFVDGKWIPDKFKEAVKLQKEIQEVLDYISTVEFEARLSALKMDVRGTDLTVESFKAILEEAHSTIEDQLSNLEAVRLENLKIAKMEFDQTGNQQAYDEALEVIESEFNKKRLELNFKTFDFGMETLQEAFAEELAMAEPVFGTTFKDAFRKGFIQGVANPEEIYKMPLDQMMADLQMAYHVGIQDLDISSAARKNMKNLVKALQPREDEYAEIASSALKAGELVPEEVNRGLTASHKLKAIAGSIESQNYMVGRMLSTDTSFLKLLATSENAGRNINKDVAKGLANNLTLVKNEATGTVTGIKNAITGEVINITPILKDNLKALGINIGEGLEQGVNEGVKEKEYRNIFQKIGDWFKDHFGIRSPSRVFMELGRNLSQGLLEGVSSNISSNERSWKNIWTSLWRGARTTSDTELSATNRTVSNKLSEMSSNMNTSDIRSTWRKLWEPFGDTVDKELAWADKQLGWGISDLVHRLKWNDISSAWRNIWNNLSTPRIKLPHFSITGSFSLSPPSIPKISVKWYGEGGLPDVGELFVAREAGPELVGSIGGRTAVANNDQIVTAVSEGVAKAVSKVLGQGNSSGDVVLQVGELELGRISKLAINKYNKQTGNVTVEV